MKEKTLCNEIMELLRETPFCWVMKTTGQMSVSGAPDIIGHYNGKAVFIEVKTPTGIVSKLQKKVLMDIHRTGAYVTVARSKADVINFLKMIDHGMSPRRPV